MKHSAPGHCNDACYMHDCACLCIVPTNLCLLARSVRTVRTNYTRSGRCTVIFMSYVTTATAWEPLYCRSRCSQTQSQVGAKLLPEALGQLTDGEGEVRSAHDHHSPASTSKAQVVHQQQRSRHMHHDGCHCTAQHQNPQQTSIAMQLNLQQITSKPCLLLIARRLINHCNLHQTIA
jgi:hypothetical protein